MLLIKQLRHNNAQNDHFQNPVASSKTKTLRSSARGDATGTCGPNCLGVHSVPRLVPLALFGICLNFLYAFAFWPFSNQLLAFIG